MPARLPCPTCGGRIDVPDDHTRAKIRCPLCGYYAPVPADLRSAPAAVTADAPTPTAAPTAPKPGRRARPQIDPRDHRPRFEDDGPAGPNLLDGSTDEDDDRPYTVPGDSFKKCPECRWELPHDATLCVSCGVEIGTGKRPAKSFQPVNRTWESRFDFDTRLKIFGAFVAIDLFLLIMFWGFSLGGVFVFQISVAIQAFLIGTYEAITVRRSAEGKVSVTKTWRFAFVKVKPKKLAWRDSQGLGIVGRQNTGLLEWFTFLYLFLQFFFLPGILFYWFVMRPDRFDVALCDVYGSTDAIAYRATDREQADDVCRALSDCTGLWYKPVL